MTLVRRDLPALRGGLDEKGREETVSEADSYVPAEWLYLVLDLWMATGRDSLAFDPFVAEHGAATTWALLLSEIRRKPRCWNPLDGEEWCVLSEGHMGPCYGSDDVAASVFLPRPTRLPGTEEK